MIPTAEVVRVTAAKNQKLVVKAQTLKLRQLITRKLKAADGDFLDIDLWKFHSADCEAVELELGLKGFTTTRPAGDHSRVMRISW